MSSHARYSLFLIAAMPLAAMANTFCCEVNGKTFCDDGIPAACYGKAYRQLNNAGVVTKHYAAPLTPEQQKLKDAELARQREEEEKKAEQERLDRKLVSAYATLSDLDIGHERILSDLKKGQQIMEKKLAESQKLKQKLGNEAEFYKKGALPKELKTQMDANEQEIEAHKKAIEARGQEIGAAKLRFEEEKQRYMRLTAGTDRLR
ncbi:MAG: hypothetical protein KGL40_01185 [Rhodocyclaceae bacterium]|nr:hypothetical protein [Rhodocyclaceae bacterium]